MIESLRIRYIFRFMYIVLLYISRGNTKNVLDDAELLAKRMKTVFREDWE